MNSLNQSSSNRVADWRGYPCMCGSGREHRECCARDSAVEMTLDGLLAVITMNNTQALDSAGEGWSEHTKELSDWIKSISASLPDLSTARVAVIGAGNCSDIPLEFLSREFSKVHLFDLDWAAVSQARSRLDPVLAERVACFSYDVTGLYTSFVPKVLQHLHTGEIERVFQAFQKFGSSAAAEPRPRLPDAYDLVLSINVVSQLFCPFMHSLAHAAAQARRFKDDESFATFGRWIRRIGDTHVVKEHLKFLAAATKEDGRALVSTDRFFWGFENGEAAPAAQMFREPESMLDPGNLERMTQAGLALPGTGVGSVCTDYFDQQDTRRWLWRFNPQQAYLVEGYELTPKSAPSPRNSRRARRRRMLKS